MARSAYKEFLSKQNFLLAWQRLRSADNPQLRRYYALSRSAFSLALEDNLNSLIEEVKSGYEPEGTQKLFEVKKSGIQRPITLLTLKDLLVYQALANVIAEIVRPRVSRYYGTRTFGHVLSDRGDLRFFQDWRKNFKKFNRAQELAWKKGLHWLADFDLTAFYDSVSHSVLEQVLTKDLKCGDRDVLDLLIKCLKRWSATDAKYYQSHGIPQGHEPSRFLGECILTFFAVVRI